jgi:hypothetical protein
LGLLVSGYAQSQPPIPSGAKQGDEPPKDAKTDQPKPPVFQIAIPHPPAPIRIVEPPAQKAIAAQNTNHAEDKTPDWWMVGITGVMALVAIVQVGLFLRQLRIMQSTVTDAKIAAEAARDSAETMKDTAKKQLRAYMSFTTSNISSFDETHGPKIKVSYTNHGQTPASDLMLYVYIGVMPYEGILNAALPDIQESFTPGKRIIHPNASKAERPFAIYESDLFLSGEELARIRNKTYALVWGIKVKYMDVFGKEQRITQSFYWLEAEPGVLTRLTTYGQGNIGEMKHVLLPQGGIAT